MFVKKAYTTGLALVIAALCILPIVSLPVQAQQAIGKVTILGTCGLTFPNGNTINYGALAVNATSNETGLNMTNSGTTTASLEIRGGDWKDSLGSAVMYANRTHYNNTAFQPTYISKAPLNNTDTTVTSSFEPSQLLKIFFQLKAVLINPTFSGNATQSMNFTVTC